MFPTPKRRGSCGRMGICNMTSLDEHILRMLGEPKRNSNPVATYEHFWVSASTTVLTLAVIVWLSIR